MKQYQINYENKADFGRWLDEIRSENTGLSAGKIIFYMSWMKSAEADVTAAAEEIEKQFPYAAYYGNEASGNIAMGKISYGLNVAAYVFEGETTGTELVWVEQGTELSSLRDLWTYCNAKQNLCAIELIPSISYLDVLRIDRDIPDIDRKVLIFGGGSVNYDNATFDADIIAKGHKLTRSGMAVMLYFGEDLKFYSTDILGWKGLGRMMSVTGSDGKTIREIDNVPAYSIYEKYLGLSRDDEDSLVFPLIVEEGGNQFIRTPQIIQEDKSMKMFADMPEGTQVQIAYGDKNTILSSLNEKLPEIAAHRPQAIKAFSCAARRLFWGDAEVPKETLPLQEIAPVCGFYTGGEILRFGDSLRVLNQTLAIVCMREGEGKELELPPVAKQSVDTSLISRLTYFAEKIVEEEKAQRVLAEGFESVFKSQYQVMYHIDLKEGKSTFLHGDEDAKKFLPIFNTNSLDVLFSNFYKYYIDAVIVDEDRERVKSVMNAENVFRQMKFGNSISVNYRVRRNLVDPVYTEMRIIKAGEENGSLTAVILGFRLTDEELKTALETQKKMKEDARIIGALSEDFGCVDYVELTYDKFKDVTTGIRSSALLRRLIPGWDEEKTFSKKLDLLINNLVYEPDRKMFYKASRREAILKQLAKTDVYYINTRMLIEGEVRYYQVKVSAIKDKGELAGFVVGTRSVDEETRKEQEAQKQLEAALESAEVANKSKSSFLFNMSHDIRTPMNAIKGFTAMARKYSDDEEKVKDYLGKIDIAGQQLLTLINQVLEMSRIESGKIEFNDQPVNIRDRFESMITIIAAQAKAKGLDFTYGLDNVTHYNVLADDSRMGQITLNVVGNAIKFTPEGGKIDFRLTEIAPRREGFASYVYTVEDTGIGMSKEYLETIFEPFSREKSSTVSRIQGTGLGMSIVKQLVDLKGGDIKVTSEQGKGSRFDITLDFRLADDVAIIKENPAVSKVSAASFEGRRVLLVEDNEMNREIAKDLLEEYGFIVEEAEDGDIAVEMMQQIAKRGDYRYYDYVLMDIQMPHMNGYDATRAIRAIPSTENTRVPIIAMTANAFDEDRRNALAAGMDEHLAKPIDIQKLLETLAKFL